MKFTDELKICDDKIKVNQAQYDLDREAAKTSALSSKDLDKYEYLTVEELALKPQPIEIKQAEYSPLAQIITKGIKKMIKWIRPPNMTIWCITLCLTLINTICLILIK